MTAVTWRFLSITKNNLIPLIFTEFKNDKRMIKYYFELKKEEFLDLNEVTKIYFTNKNSLPFKPCKFSENESSIHITTSGLEIQLYSTKGIPLSLYNYNRGSTKNDNAVRLLKLAMIEFMGKNKGFFEEPTNTQSEQLQIKQLQSEQLQTPQISQNANSNGPEVFKVVEAHQCISIISDIVKDKDALIIKYASQINDQKICDKEFRFVSTQENTIQLIKDLLDFIKSNKSTIFGTNYVATFRNSKIFLILSSPSGDSSLTLESQEVVISLLEKLLRVVTL